MNIILFFIFSFFGFSSESKTELLDDGSQYVGQTVGGLREGYGVQTWPNGSRYEGYWSNDLRNGTGLFVWPDGRYYYGKWTHNWPGDYLKNPNIFSIYNLDDIQKKFPKKKPTKRGLILESTDDYNDAFGAKNGEYALLSEGLKLKGIDATVVHYSSLIELKQKIQLHTAQKMDLIWVRAHGSHQTIQCGKDVCAAEHLADLIAPRLSQSGVIVLDSCETGVPNGVAEQLKNILCRSGIHPRIIAPVEEIAYSGFDMASEELEVLMINAISGQNVAKTFHC
jgi:hypothetical protein